MVSSGYGMFGIRDVLNVGSSGCGMIGMWDGQDVGYSGYWMLGMWDVRDKRIFWMCYVWDVRWLGCGMFRMWDILDVVCSGCGMFGYAMFGLLGVGCSMFAGMWDVDLQNTKAWSYIPCYWELAWKSFLVNIATRYYNNFPY